MKNLITIKLTMLVIVVLGWASCENIGSQSETAPNTDWQKAASNADFIHKPLQEITDVIVHDIFSPPVASRIYAYATVAAYEAMRPGYPAYQTFAGQLNGLEPTPQPEQGKDYCYEMAGAKAMIVVGKQLIFSEDKINEFEEQLMADFRKTNMPNDVMERSLAYGEMVGKHILAWADKDNYKQTRTFPKYTITDNTARWKPTPPDYMDAIEPHWNDIRPFTLDSAQQFKPVPPTPFDMKNKNGEFYKQVMEVYNAVNTPDKEDRIAIAKFWDCNPYVSHHQGHVMFATKKITPGGHWMGIAQIACKKANSDAMLSAKTYALVAISLADGFISCWDEKYRSELIRPETVINTYVDPKWVPVLQTPPFPEYTSGHSVISTAAATALTSVYGENFAYTDSVEVKFGMPPRNFNSFMEACNEAAISRLYGGIHYMPACIIGQDQGKIVGEHVLASLKLKND